MHLLDQEDFAGICPPIFCNASFIIPQLERKKKVIIFSSLTATSCEKKVAAGLNFPVKLGNSRGPTLKFSNAAVITCNHSDIHQRTSSSLNHHLNNLSCSDRLRKEKKKKRKNFHSQALKDSREEMSAKRQIKSHSYLFLQRKSGEI